MTLKLVTFDLAAAGRSVQIATALESIGDSVRLSDTSFVVDTSMTTADILKKLMKAVDLEDEVYVLELSSFWSAYGSAAVSNFLNSRTREGFDLPQTV